MHDLRAWLRERMPIRRFGPLALLIGLLGAPVGWESAARIGLAWLLIATFRLRDDLADRERDAIVHGDRVLVRARSIRPFVIAMMVGLLLGSVGLSLIHGI